jgi:hypothetical protein
MFSYPGRLCRENLSLLVFYSLLPVSSRHPSSKFRRPGSTHRNLSQGHACSPGSAFSPLWNVYASNSSRTWWLHLALALPLQVQCWGTRALFGLQGLWVARAVTGTHLVRDSSIGNYWNNSCIKSADSPMVNIYFPRKLSQIFKRKQCFRNLPNRRVWIFFVKQSDVTSCPLTSFSNPYPLLFQWCIFGPTRN